MLPTEIAGPQPTDPAPTRNDLGTELGRDDFLKMLVTQLENQDPLNPQDPTEFTAQLAQFSTLEQLLAIRRTLEASSHTSSLQRTLEVAGLIGREVLARGSQLELAGPGAPVPPIEFELDERATSVTAFVRDAQGRLVRTIPLGAAGQGRHRVTWDGKDDFGADLPAGVYSLSLEAKNGSTRIEVTPLERGVVTGTAAAQGPEGSPALLLGARVVPADALVEIVQPGAGG